MIATLALEDGTVAIGESVGAPGTAAGEVVFNTAMTGYQEVLTDPSYRRQIVVMTCPHIGNYGINEDDVESARPQVAGFVVRECSRRYSNHRATRGLSEYLRDAGIVAIAEVDTRTITQGLRSTGAMRGVVSTEQHNGRALVEQARCLPPMSGSDLTQEATTKASYVFPTGDAHGSVERRPLNVVVIDCGVKRNILRSLAAINARVTVVPAAATAETILESRPDGVLVGNGPGDPAAAVATIRTLRGLIGRVPVFGICLGHQMLALALGVQTYKLKFGHHGVNHPVLNHVTGGVEITSQNHGFAVAPSSLDAAGLRPTHTNLFDGSLEGYSHRSLPLFAVQYHPEAAPGPHDSSYLFRCFRTLMESRNPLDDETIRRLAIP